MERKKYPTLKQTASFLIICWTLVILGFLSWNVKLEFEHTVLQATHQTRTFFKKFLLTRFWNSMHGGIYVPITEVTPPNEYLDDPERDLTTVEGVRLTKMNPAYMTRQIGEISQQVSEIQLHLAGLHPMSPKNLPDEWEKKALESFSDKNEEFYEMIKTDDQERVLRYMGALIYHESCLECHKQVEAKVGALGGGITLTLPIGPLIDSRNRQIVFLVLTYILIWGFGVVSLLALFKKLQIIEAKKESLITQLQESLSEVKKLSGLLPICCSCKKIRDDEGYWQELEKYIGNHSEAQFSHGLCHDCAVDLYPQVFEKKNKE